MPDFNEHGTKHIHRNHYNSSSKQKSVNFKNNMVFATLSNLIAIAKLANAITLRCTDRVATAANRKRRHGENIRKLVRMMKYANFHKEKIGR